jgi:hypothetical protein
MDAADLAAFLTPRQPCLLAARTVAGGLLAGIGYAVLHDGLLRVELPADGHAEVGEALRSDGRACCIVERALSYFEMVSAVVRGRAQHLEIDAESIVFELPLDDVVSSDFAKLVPDYPSASAGKS